MIVYTVHEPTEPPAAELDRATALDFIADGFSWGAFLLGPLWLLARRAWLAAAIDAIVLAGIVGALALLGASGRSILIVVVALQAWLGFEAGSILRWNLEKRGWRMLGSVTGRNREDCERRFFQDWLGAGSLPREQQFSREKEFMATVAALRGMPPEPQAAAGSSVTAARPSGLGSLFGWRRGG